MPMIYMLCRNRVVDFAKWKAVFASHAGAHQKAGLQLINILRSVEEPNNVFITFEVASMDKAREFISKPEAAQAGEAAGVIDAEFHLIEDVGGY